jgi:hypothetical protein
MLPQQWGGDKRHVNAAARGTFSWGMKSITCAIVVCAGAAGAAPARPPQPESPPLRQTLQQYHPGATAPRPRELTPVERAELRRQLVEYGLRRTR